MKITEIIQSKSLSAIQEGQARDLVSQDIVSHNGDLALDLASYIDEGVAQILRRVKGKGLKSGFRCTSGPRKGRIVAQPSTCFAKLQPSKGFKIKKKRQAKASIAGKKLAVTKRSGGASRRLKAVQVKSSSKADRSLKKGSGKMSGTRRSMLKSKIVKPKK